MSGDKALIKAKEQSVLFIWEYNFFRFYLTKAELLALTPQDIDFDNKVIRITKSYQRLEGKDVVTDPKTPKSKRNVSMPDFLCEELKEYIGRLYGLLPTDRIFHLTKSFLHHEMTRGAGKAGVKRIRIHDLSYPNLNKIQTFQKKDVNRNKYRLKKFGYYFYLFLLIPQKSTREPSGFFHFADTFLSFSSSRVASAFAFSSTVISR